MEIELGFEKFRFKSELDELIRIVQILRTQFDSKSKKILKELLDEIEKIHSKIVGPVAPFYELNSEDIFKKEFSNRYQEFKKIHLKNLKDVGFSCDEAKKKFDTLNNKSNDKTLRELENLIDRWYAQDKIVYHQLDELQDRLNDGLNKINTIYFTNENSKESLKKLQSFLMNSEKLFFEFKKSFNKLKKISNELQ